MPEFIAALRQSGDLGARPLEFLILTVMRPNEVLLARWEHIDEEARVWTAQPEDIKGRPKERDKPHRVPLSDRAMEIIAEMKPLRNGPFLFPGTKENRPLWPGVMGLAIKRIGWTGVTAHGFRSTFDTWATNETRYSPQAVEFSLTHIVKAAIEAGVNPAVRKAYQHGDMLELRRPLMEDWAVAALTGMTPKRAKRPDYTEIAA